ncbi:MAG: efflux RND transporter periplasmic adaptor subunit [Planctomycetaceae bacterium]|nr:efflux RND transporter periplasmic adaptor subunit [Planctomycetaceae bacterium]
MNFRVTKNLAKSLFFSGLLLFLAAQSGCGQKQAQSSSDPTKIPRTEVVIDHVGQEDVQLYIYVEGRTVPYKSVDIRARISGYLEQLFFESGGIVKQGDRLALIEQDQYQVALDAAKAELAVTEAKAVLAKANLDRGRQLVESKTIAIEEFQSRQAEYQTAQASVELAKTSVRRAELDLQYTDMTAPITGKTTKNLVDIGNYVSPTGNQAVLLSIAQMDPIYIDFFISDRQFIDLKERLGFREKFNDAIKNLNETTNQTENNESENESPLSGDSGSVDRGTIDIALSTGANVLTADFSLRGKIVALVDNQITLNTGQITLRGEIRNPLLRINGRDDYMIYPGQICRVRIPYEMVKNAVLIREEAIQTDLDTKYVLTVSKEMFTPTDQFNRPLKDQDGNPVPAYETDVVKRRDIKIGRLLDTQMRIVLDGLKPDETYIVKGLQRVRIGMAVAPITLDEYNARRAAEGGTAVKKEKSETKEEPKESPTTESTTESTTEPQQ